MKMTSIFTASVASAALVMASAVSAAPVITMTGAAATQMLTLSGCKTLKTVDTVSVTFDDAGNTYSIVDSGSNTVLQGTWFKLDGKTPTSPYTIYMSPEVFAPDPNAFDPIDPVTPAGSLDDFLSQIEVTAETAPPAGMTCKLKGTGTQSVSLHKASALVKKSTLVVKTNKDNTKSGTLTFQAAGKETSMFTGVPKNGKFSAKLTITGTVL